MGSALSKANQHFHAGASMILVRARGHGNEGEVRVGSECD